VAKMLWMFNAETKHEKMGVLLFFLVMPAAIQICIGCALHFGLEETLKDNMTAFLTDFDVGWIMGWSCIPKMMDGKRKKCSEHLQNLNGCQC